MESGPAECQIEGENRGEGGEEDEEEEEGGELGYKRGR